MEVTAYNITNDVTCTVDSSNWHLERVNGVMGMFIIQRWLNIHSKGLVGGFIHNGNSIKFQKEEDVVFFRLGVGPNDTYRKNNSK